MNILAETAVPGCSVLIVALPLFAAGSDSEKGLQMREARHRCCDICCLQDWKWLCPGYVFGNRKVKLKISATQEKAREDRLLWAQQTIAFFDVCFSFVLRFVTSVVLLSRSSDSKKATLRPLRPEWRVYTTLAEPLAVTQTQYHGRS